MENDIKQSLALILSAHKLKVHLSLLQRTTCSVFTGNMGYAQSQATKLALTKKLFLYLDQSVAG